MVVINKLCKGCGIVVLHENKIPCGKWKIEQWQIECTLKPKSMKPCIISFFFINIFINNGNL